MIIKKNQDEFENYLTDASNFKGFAEKLFIPESVEELRQIVSECYVLGCQMTVSAARTGLTGGSVPLSSTLISTERLNKIKCIDQQNKTVTLEPGVVIKELQTSLEKFGLFYPPNPTEQNSTIGGNVATNASGAKTFKYGSTRNYVKRLKMILADADEIELIRGDVVEKNGVITLLTKSGRDISIPINDINMPPIKHAAGYFIKEGMDAIDLIIGSEGTLGIIYEIELEVLDLPEAVLGGLVFFHSDDSLIKFVDELRNISNKYLLKDQKSVNTISSRLIEFFDDKSLNLLRVKYSQIPVNCCGAIWFEQEYLFEHEDSLIDEWYKFIGKHSEYVDDTWFAIDDVSHKKLNEFRHDLPLFVFEIISQNNSFKIGTDTAVPKEYLDEYYHFLKNTLTDSGLTYYTWGHIGNTHFHANLLTSCEDENRIAIEVYIKIIERALDLKGTVSAEHGIGKLKRKYLQMMFGDEKINYMKSIKLIFDNKLLLNRSNLFEY